ncbi:RHS repeat domain-containing protein [Candidatus Margulisiibacteriota bacterium]
MDKNGNPTTFSQVKGTTVQAAAQVVNPKSDRLTSKSYPNGRNMTFSYDSRGNLTTKTRSIGSTNYPTITYNYNYQNQLKSVKEGSTIIAEYSYDTNKQLIYKNIIKSGYQTQKYYYWDLAGRIIGEVNNSTNKTTRYIYSGNEKIAMIFPDKSGNDQVYYFINNLQGTPIYVINTNGTIKHRQLLDEFGNEERKTLGEVNEITFTGKQYEPATKLFYFNQRWYDPDTGRFLQTDPAAQGPNLYAYCKNSPLNYVDPDGRWAFSDIAKAFQGITHITSTLINMNNGQGFNEAWNNSYTASNIARQVGTVFTNAVLAVIGFEMSQSVSGLIFGAQKTGGRGYDDSAIDISTTDVYRQVYGYNDVGGLPEGDYSNQVAINGINPIQLLKNSFYSDYQGIRQEARDISQGTRDIAIKGAKGAYNKTAAFVNSAAPEAIAYSIIYAGPMAAIVYPPLAIPVAYSYGPALTVIALKQRILPLPKWK